MKDNRNKMNVFRRVVAVAALGFTLGLVSCSDNASDEPSVQVVAKGEIIEFSSEATLELPSVMGMGDEENLKAFNYKMDANGAKGYPKPSIQFSEGEQVPVLCVIRNEASRSTARPVIIQELNFTYKSGKLVAESLPLSLPTGTDLNANPRGWRMICIVGADSYDAVAGKVSFSSGTVLPKSATFGDMRQLKALYMNKDKGGADSWAKLEVVNNPSGSGKIFRTVEPVNLVSQGAVLMVRVMNTTRADKSLRGFEVESNTLSFGGTIDELVNTTVNSGLPKFKRSTGYINYSFLDRPETVSRGTVTEGVYMLYAIPDKTNTNKTTITPYVGTRYEKAKSYRYTFNPDLNKFYSLRTIELAQPTLTHPIEAMLTSNQSGSAYVGPVGKYDGGQDVAASTLNESGEFVRVYSLPSEKQVLALFPYSTGGGPLGVGSYGILNFGDGKYYPQPTKSEVIEAFGSEATYDAEYINSSTNISYALRFKGGNGNKYFSAYRYEKTSEGVKITVRVLGPERTGTRLADISKESYWNAAPEFEQKEFVRTIPSGKYWTSTVVTEAGGKYATLVRVFETDGASGMNQAKNSAWVTDRRFHKDHPGLTGLNRSPYLLFTNVE